MTLFAGTVVVAVVLLAVFAVAPALRIFDSKRARGVFLGVAGVLVVVGGVAVTRYARYEATRRERRASIELLAALEAAGPAKAATGVGVLPGVVRTSVADDGSVLAFRPVEVAWLRWCVVGTVDPKGSASVRRVHAPCP